MKNGGVVAQIVNYRSPGSIAALLGEAAAQDPYPTYPVQQNPDTSQWERRPDGSEKGMGWLG
jgi:hypothetical protein